MEEKIKLAQSGDKEIMERLLTENKQLVNSVARKYFLMGGDVDDLIQEGMIALYNAILTFDDNKNISFKNYAYTLIERNIISSIKKANNKKNTPLNDAMNVNNQGAYTYLLDGEEMDGFVLESNKPNPENELLNMDRYNEMMQKILETLSGYENKVLDAYLKGYNYQDIAQMFNATPKSVDNALNRIKNKLNFLRK